MGETCGQVIHVRPLGQNEDTQSKRPGTDDRKLHTLTFKYTGLTEEEKLGSWAHAEPRNKTAEACSVPAPRPDTFQQYLAAGGIVQHPGLAQLDYWRVDAPRKGGDPEASRSGFMNPPPQVPVLLWG